LKPGVTGFAESMALVRKEQKGVKIAKMEAKIMFTKTSKTGHFLMFVNVGNADNQQIEP